VIRGQTAAAGPRRSRSRGRVLRSDQVVGCGGEVRARGDLGRVKDERRPIGRCWPACTPVANATATWVCGSPSAITIPCCRGSPVALPVFGSGSSRWSSPLGREVNHLTGIRHYSTLNQPALGLMLKPQRGQVRTRWRVRCQRARRWPSPNSSRMAAPAARRRWQTKQRLRRWGRGRVCLRIQAVGPHPVARARPRHGARTAGANPITHVNDARVGEPRGEPWDPRRHG
jgi:hypothetical protein